MVSSAISGGDLSDDGSVTPEVIAFKEKFLDRNMLLLEAVGNHDRHTYDYNGFGFIDYIKNGAWNMDINDPVYHDYLYRNGGLSTGCYRYKDVLSIYVLDSSMRTFSRKQLDYLEDALRQDTARYRICISHDNIVTGGVFDQSLFVTGFADLSEVTRYIKIMKKHHVSLVISGHHHKGNILYGDGDSYMEFNAAAYHRADSDLESRGWWYTFLVDPVHDRLVMDGYDAETSQRKMTKVFSLKKS